MRVRIKYCFLKFVSDLPNGFGGIVQGPLIKILPKYKKDAGLLEHEKTHVRQWYVVLALWLLLSSLLTLLISPSLWPLYCLAPFVHQLLHKFVRPYRRWSKVKAYRKQIGFGAYASNEFAVNALAEKYNLKLSVDDAMELLFD